MYVIPSITTLVCRVFVFKKSIPVPKPYTLPTPGKKPKTLNPTYPGKKTLNPKPYLPGEQKESRDIMRTIWVVGMFQPKSDTSTTLQPPKCNKRVHIKPLTSKQILIETIHDLTYPTHNTYIHDIMCKFGHKHNNNVWPMWKVLGFRV